MHFIYNSDFVTSSMNWVNTYKLYQWHLIKPSEVHKVEREQSSFIFSIWTLDSPLPLPFFSVALPFLIFLNSPSMTSVKRICFPASSLSTRTRRRVIRKQAMWTVSTEISTPAQCWARIGQQVIRTEVGTAPLDTADIRANYRYSNTSGQRKLGACCVQWLDQALECLSNPVLLWLLSLLLLPSWPIHRTTQMTCYPKARVSSPCRCPLGHHWTRAPVYLSSSHIFHSSLS